MTTATPKECAVETSSFTSTSVMRATASSGQVPFAFVKDRKIEQIENTHAANTVYTAEIVDYISFVPAVDISSKLGGKRNRQLLGLPDNLNDAGYSRSMVSITSELFDKILNLGVRQPTVQDAPSPENWRIEDSWSKVKKRMKVEAFRAAVLARHKFRCVVCWKQVRCTLTAAHIRPWTSDLDNRANPANGICLCVYCHRIFDDGLIHLKIDGTLELSKLLSDEVAAAHFTRLPASTRKLWMSDIDPTFLDERNKS